MKNEILLLILVFLLFTACKKPQFKYPRTKRVDTVDVYFGTKVPDPYRWLEDDNSEETAQWVNEQNELTFSYLKAIPCRAKIEERLTQLWNYPKQTAPVKKGGKYFFLKNDGLQEQDVLYYTQNLDSAPIEIVNPNTWSADGNIALMTFDVSKDGRFLAYSLSQAGSDWRDIYIQDLETGKGMDDHLRWIKFSTIAWHKDGFFYSHYAPPKEGKELSNINLHHKLYYHKVGTYQEDDQLIYVPESDKRICVGLTTEDEKYLIISESESSIGNSISIKNLENPKSEIIKLTTGFDYNYVLIGNVADHLIFQTNYRAPNYRLISININSLELGSWKDILPQQKEVLEKCIIAGNKVVACYLEDAKNTMRIYDLEGNRETEIDLHGMGTVEELTGKRKDNELFYSFNTFANPLVVYRYDLRKNKQDLIFTPEVDIHPDDYMTEQIFYYSKDSTKIPMFLIYKKGIKKDGNNPVFLYGYGGFNINMTPYYSSSRIIWLENGGIYALPNIRGGGEYGEKWHQAGIKLNKQNVFDDFIGAAEYLIAENYTKPELLAIHGGSNGGLLVGAVTNQRPDLFKVAIPSVGVMDMLRFHKFTIGWAWVSDYGSSDDSVMFKYIMQYSPLHNISEEKEYPAILVMTADHDDRVVPAHSFKYIATLQKKYKGPNPVMIRIQVDAGHGEGTPTKAIIREATDLWAFTFHNMGVVPHY